MKSTRPPNPAARPTVVIGVLGTVLDRADGPERWSRWRPSVALCQQEDLLVNRFELLHDPKFSDLAKHVQQDIGTISSQTQVNLVPMVFDNPWDFAEVFERLYNWAQEYPFDPENENYLVHLTPGTHVVQICWFLLIEARYVPGRLLQTSPMQGRARDAVPAGTYEIIDLDLSRYDRIATRLAQEKVARVDFLRSGIQTKNKAFNQLMEQMEQVALKSTHPMLLTGPTGAGKSMLAGRIYELRKQRQGLTGNFVEVNCATLRGDHAMSTLFGHKRGAFTGAQSDRPGLLKEADRGLVFLDEIGELGMDEQAMLLQALETKSFLPLGSDKLVRSEFQLITGTNRDLRAEVATGKFREDLLARINLWTFTLPSLAERREDLPANLEFELEKFSRQQHKQVRFNKEALTKFLKFARSPEATWNANFRDLNAAATRMATLAPQGRITEECVTAEIARLQWAWQRPDSSNNIIKTRLPASLAATLDPVDVVQLEYVVNVCQQSKSLSEAGRKLYAISRLEKVKVNDADRLKKYLAKFGLEWSGDWNQREIGIVDNIAKD
jgi:transcriptional regulatory protein RtcR